MIDQSVIILLNLLDQHRNADELLQRQTQCVWLAEWYAFSSEPQRITNLLYQRLDVFLPFVRKLRERDFAYRMLLDMLPDAPPNFADFDIYGKSIFSDELGGDYYNFIRLPNGDLNIVIADAKGHGMTAAATVSLLHNALLRSMVQTEAQMGEVVTRLNRKLMKRTTEDNFATMSYIELSPDGAISYCNAGQNPPLLFSSSGYHELTAGGPILGVFDSIPYETGQEQLAENGVLVQYTDGVTEATNEEDELFGVQRLVEIIQEHRTSSSEEIVNQVLEAAMDFGQNLADDMTVIVAKPTGL